MKKTKLSVIREPMGAPVDEQIIYENEDPQNYENLVTEATLLLEQEYGSDFVNVMETTDE